MRLNALWWWIDRWRKSTAYTDMTLEEQGAYRNLLDEAQLRGGPLPNDERILGKACGDALAWKRVRTAVLARFHLTPEGWRNETLDEVISESQKRADKQRRWRLGSGNGAGNGHGNANGNGAGNAAGNRAHSPDPSPSPVLDPSPERVQAAAPRDAVSPSARAGAFCELYGEMHEKYRGVPYIGNARRDYEEALQLVAKCTDEQLRHAAVVFLNADDDFARSRTATVAMFRSRVPWCLERLKERGIA